MINNLSSPDISVRLGKLLLKNPVMLASGTSGYGEEYSRFIDLNKLGAIIPKSISLRPRVGNPARRIVETSGGMLSSIGLQNVGVEGFIHEKLPFLRRLDTQIIASIFGSTTEEFYDVAMRLDETEGISALEVNISCPNVKEGGMLFGVDPEQTYSVVKAVRQATKLPLIVKLTPNVTDIAVIAKAAVEAKADILTLINNPLGIAVDINTRAPVLANIRGGLSGPSIKPIALRMLWEVSRENPGVPLIGVGGICNSNDAIEFLITGASAVQVGSASFVDPEVSINIINGIKQYCLDNGIGEVMEMIGTLNT